jgi:hypothetical protein
MRRYALRDDQWDRIKDILPGREGHVGATAEYVPTQRSNGSSKDCFAVGRRPVISYCPGSIPAPTAGLAGYQGQIPSHGVV